MRRPYRALTRMQVTVIVSLLIGLVLLVSSNSVFDPAFGHLLGLSNASTAALPGTLSIAITPRAPVFNPPAAAISANGAVTFRNDLNTPLLIRSTAPSPAQ